MKNLSFAAPLLCCFFSLSSLAWAQQKSVPLGSGELGGSDHAAASAICRFNNQLSIEGKSTCLAMVSKGSVYNLAKLRAGEFRVALATPGTASAAYTGGKPFQDAGPYKELRTLFSLSPSFVMMAVAKNSSINKFEDIPGKRIYIELSGVSSTSTVIGDILNAFNIAPKDLVIIPNLSYDAQSKALCKGEIEAFVMSTGAGSKFVEHALECGARLVPIVGPQAEQLAKNNVALRMVEVPANSYHGQNEPIKTLAETDTVVTTTQVSADEAYAIVKSVFENLDEMKKSHTAFKNLDPKIMSKEALGGVPLHEGAIRYFKEKGLIN